MSIEITISFKGAEAEDHLLDFYDAAGATSAFQRTLALTAHLVMNGEIITQAPALKGAKILSKPYSEGSWEATAIIFLGSTVFAAGLASRDSVFGHLFTSIYDFVISNTLGFHVDFEKSLGQQIREAKRNQITSEKLDAGKMYSLAEKIDTSVKEMHRPIFASKSATSAELSSNEYGKRTKIGPALNIETYEYVNVTHLNELPRKWTGKVSSYNSNTFKGRIYIESEGRPIPFELADRAREMGSIGKIVRSLSSNAVARFDVGSEISFEAFSYESKLGTLKSFLILHVD
jgi:hypothetical protein